MSRSLCLRRALQVTSLPHNGRSIVPSGTAARRNGTAAGSLAHQTPSRHFAMAPGASVTTTDAPQSLDVADVDESVAEKKARERLKRIVRRHLDHMSDPWKIAQYVEQTLQKDNFDEALLLTKEASKNGQFVVAWNHLINYQLGKDRLKPAIQLYNDMKKRGQLPNVQTFTIIFRGCAKSNHPKLAIAEAMKHYNVLLSSPRLQPNSTHLNAVLNVCARAGDLDSLFLAAETINDSTRAPTAYTYTTIFNALRHHAIKKVEGLPEEQQLANIQKAIDRAKSIWTEVIDKWRRGRLVIDEELVCSMGRILLLSRNREEKRNILDLVQQTMNIPNLAKGSEEGSDVPPEEPDMHNIAVSGFTKTVPATTAVYAIPGRNTLALVLTILASAKLTTCGIRYWNLMVQHYGIIPDNDNWLRLFGMLKVARASAHAASILPLVPDALIGPTHFRIAMDTCVRDNINVNAVANADRVLDCMLSRLAIPDLQALRSYLRVALVSHHHLRQKAQDGEQDLAKRKYGTQIADALARLWDPYKKTHYHFFKASAQQLNDSHDDHDYDNDHDKRGKRLGQLYNDKREVIALARHMFSAFNKVINERMLPDHDLRKLRSIGAKINREIQAFFSNREELEPKLRKSSTSIEPKDPIAGALDAKETTPKRGGDFVWNTTKPLNIMTRDDRRQKEWEQRKKLAQNEEDM